MARQKPSLGHGFRFMLIFYYHNDSDLQTVIILAGKASQASDGGGIFTIHQNGFAPTLVGYFVFYHGLGALIIQSNVSPDQISNNKRKIKCIYI